MQAFLVNSFQVISARTYTTMNFYQYLAILAMFSYRLAKPQDMNCEADEFLCLDRSKCIPRKKFCDGSYDCRDMSDESRYYNGIGNAVPCRPGTSKDGYYKMCQFPIDEAQKNWHICRNYSKCSDEEFTCADGSGCISTDDFCDRKHECSDGSDEMLYVTGTEEGITGIPCRTEMNICMLPKDQLSKQNILCTRNSTCDDNEFACADGSKCIYNNEFCDNFRHCSDSSDEITYNKSELSAQNGTPCRRDEKVCIFPSDQVEKRANFCKKDIKCNSDEFACVDGSYCLNRYQFCNGYNDCSDSSDETRYNRNSNYGIPCRQINYSIMCAFPDEQSQKYSQICTGTPKCSQYEFECIDGSGCIHPLMFCDGIAHCSDGSDEGLYNHGITEAISCRPGISVQGYFRMCQLPIDQKEKSTIICRNYGSCTEDEFECVDGSGCITAKDFCDGTSKCSDGSDEVRHIYRSEESKTGIPCRSDTLICVLPHNQSAKQKALCTRNSTCDENEFTCADGSQCIAKRSFCDGMVLDCDDRSDEISYNKFKVNPINGTACRQSKKVCILPSNQLEKYSTFCKKDINCNSDEFACTDGSYCVNKEHFCAEYVDLCKDGSEYTRYSKYIHNETDGIPCRVHRDVCLLPYDQAWKNRTLCPKRHDCDEKEFACSDGSGCIPKSSFCNGYSDCSDNSDEARYVIGLNDENGTPCRNDQRTCIILHNGTKVDDNFCNKGFQCASDEFVCADGSGCLEAKRFCDGEKTCHDHSDERKYSGEKPNGEIMCNSVDSFPNHVCLLPSSLVCDGKVHCKYEIDECMCNEDNTTTTDFLNEKCFRCLGHTHKILPISKLCDSVFDCPDLSDECLCTRANVPEICNHVLWDNENSRFPKVTCETVNSSYYTAIEIEGICNDKLECENGIDETNCNHDCEEIEDPNKWNSWEQENQKCGFVCRDSGTGATRCDKKITCKKSVFYEECQCNDHQPKYCGPIKPGTSLYLCRNYQFISTEKLCDGYADCPDGYEERHCFDKFYCNSGDRINIPSNKKCDQKRDCEDGSDELGCSFACNDTGIVEYVDLNQVCDGKIDCYEGGDECLDKCITSVFSDVDSMISSRVILPFIWIISLAAFIGNLLVAVFSFYSFLHPDRTQSKVSKLNKAMILNLSIADLLVGIYTISICIKNASQKGRYCLTDRDWRSSQTCSALGAILLIGSEQSVFTLTLITGFRMYTFLKPFGNISFKTVVSLLTLSWLVTIVLALLPFIPSTEDLFVTSIWYKQNPLFTTINHGDVGKYTNWLLLTKETGESIGETYERIGSWSLLEKLIKILNQEYTVDRRFGYYSTHGVCLPTLFPDPKRDLAWFYSLLIIILNFSAFIFIFVGYVIIYRATTRDDEALPSTGNRTKQSSRLQTKITRIIVTDFLCWMPICIMAFLRVGGLPIPRDAYVPVGLILIPINSALNPFLYSDLPDYIWDKLEPVRTRVYENCIEKVSSRIRQQNSAISEEQTNQTIVAVSAVEVPLSRVCKESYDEKQDETHQTKL